MNQFAAIVKYSLFSGITILLGGLLGRLFENVRHDELKEEILHGSVAFGGGILIAAVAFVLTPKAIEVLSLPLIGVIFLAGALCFLGLDKLITRMGGIFGQLMAMLMDFIPEAIGLGAIFAHDNRLGLLLAIFIGLQNLPESFNSYGDLRKSGYSPNLSLAILAPLSFIGIFAALAGNYFLSDNIRFIAGLMLFAAGGIMYLMFQDIAPMTKIKNHWTPALGASFGFLAGMIGEKILG